MKKLTENHTNDQLAQNIKKLKSSFPEAFIDGRIDFDILKSLLERSLDNEDERYGMHWHGKSTARQLAQSPSNGTLLPYPKDSVNWNTTQNIIIEGDNLEVLKLLQKSYAKMVKLIYIDPPYNSGKDFVYRDDFRNNIQQYLDLTNQTDESHKRLSSKTETSGRIHTTWLNMMYPRLKLAHTLLRSDGLIFVSIDDDEVAQLRMILSEIFGEENFEGHIHWRRRHNQPNDPTKMLGLVAEHILCYARDSSAYKNSGVGKVGLTGKFTNPDDDPRGSWASKPWKVGSGQSGSRYLIETPTGKVYDEEWMGEYATYDNLLRDKRIFFPDGNRGAPRKKYFRNEREKEGQCATNWWNHENFGSNQRGSDLLSKIMGAKNVFRNPKPIELMDAIISVSNAVDGDIVLDFFAGSGTFGHAVLERNAKTMDKLRFILVQLPEPLDVKRKEQKNAAQLLEGLGKPLTLSELTKERLRRVGRIFIDKKDNDGTDVGFRVFRLGTSNIRPWDPSPLSIEQEIMDAEDQIRADRSNQDIVYEIILKLGLDLCETVITITIANKTMYSIPHNNLLVCLEHTIAPLDVEPFATGIVLWSREYMEPKETSLVVRDAAFYDDATKTNFVTILQQNGIIHLKSI